MRHLGKRLNDGEQRLEINRQPSLKAFRPRASRRRLALWAKVVLGPYRLRAVVSVRMQIESRNQKMMIASVEEAVQMSPAELSDWNILSIRGRLNELPLGFPGARSVKTLHFDDVEADYPEDHLFAARPSDIQAALAFGREVGEERLLIHCYAGISRSTAIAWLILYDRFAGRPDAIREAFEAVRKLRPILLPNRHVLRLGIELLAPKSARKRSMRQIQDCLAEISPMS
jgi:predicted protein tyrosine phosphatase